MKKTLTIILLPIIFLFISCASNQTEDTTTMDQIIETDENYDLLIIYTRREQSKDSNGTEIKINLKDNTLIYHEKHWGFKASNKITKKKTKIDDEFLDYINKFTKNNFPDKAYTKEIKTKERFAFTTFRYELFVKKVEKEYKIDISSNDHTTEDQYFNNLETLFSELKSKLKLKGKY